MYCPSVNKRLVPFTTAVIYSDSVFLQEDAFHTKPS